MQIFLHQCVEYFCLGYRELTLSLKCDGQGDMKHSRAPDSCSSSSVSEQNKSFIFYTLGCFKLCLDDNCFLVNKWLISSLSVFITEHLVTSAWRNLNEIYNELQDEADANNYKCSQFYLTIIIYNRTVGSYNDL